jgi:hypothetical protein
MGHAKRGNAIANEHRKKTAPLPFRIAGYVTGNTGGVNWVKSMTPAERHAELVYAESLIEKARTAVSLCYTHVSLNRGGSRLCWALFIPVTGSRLSRKCAQHLFSARRRLKINELPS